MDKTQSYFVYCPPKSNSHGHVAKDKDLKRATKKVITSFTDNFSVTTDNRIDVTLYYNKNYELQKASSTIDKLNGLLGISAREWEHVNGEHMINGIKWEAKEKNIVDILDYVEQLNEEIFLPLSKYWISCFYHYGKSPEPNGSIMCSIESGRLFVRLNLTIPYPIDADESYYLLSKLQASLPFRLNGKHFRRLGPGKNGYGRWKLDAETQTRLDDCLIGPKTK